MKETPPAPGGGGFWGHLLVSWLQVLQDKNTLRVKPRLEITFSNSLAQVRVRSTVQNSLTKLRAFWQEEIVMKFIFDHKNLWHVAHSDF